jgi:hypothetical protein
VDRRFALGATVVRIVDRTERCVMTTNGQNGLPHDPAILAAITKLNELCLGAYATVERPGTISVGDTLTRLD